MNDQIDIGDRKLLVLVVRIRNEPDLHLAFTVHRCNVRWVNCAIADSPLAAGANKRPVSPF